MAGNSRLATAIHVAGMLSFAEQMPQNSECLAQSVNTNPVVIRRIIGLLTKHGLVKVKMGAGGGASLAKSPAQISLAEIYLALEETSVFDVPQFDETHNCHLSIVVRPVLTEVLAAAEKSLLESLSRVTLADVIEKVKTRLTESGDCGEKNQHG
jgi:Rrf2 family protein